MNLTLGALYSIILYSNGNVFHEPPLGRFHVQENNKLSLSSLLPSIFGSPKSGDPFLSDVRGCKCSNMVTEFETHTCGLVSELCQSISESDFNIKSSWAQYSPAFVSVRQLEFQRKLFSILHPDDSYKRDKFFNKLGNNSLLSDLYARPEISCNAIHSKFDSSWLLYSMPSAAPILNYVPQKHKTGKTPEEHMWHLSVPFSLSDSNFQRNDNILLSNKHSSSSPLQFSQELQFDTIDENISEFISSTTNLQDIEGVKNENQNVDSSSSDSSQITLSTWNSLMVMLVVCAITIHF